MRDLVDKMCYAQVKAGEEAVTEHLKGLELTEYRSKYTHEDLRKWGEALDKEHPRGLGEVLLCYACDWREEVEGDTAASIARLVQECHEASCEAGWWTDLLNGEDLHGKRNVPEMLCLIHSEISEALEGHRKGLMDDKLPHRSAIEVELADAMIRLCDLAGGLNLDLGGAVAEKLAYNAIRSDHKPENRRMAGGKSF